MAKVTLELDDALLGAAAHALGTQGAADTVRAALEAATRIGSPRPRIPPYPGPDVPPSATHRSTHARRRAARSSRVLRRSTRP